NPTTESLTTEDSVSEDSPSENPITENPTTADNPLETPAAENTSPAGETGESAAPLFSNTVDTSEDTDITISAKNIIIDMDGSGKLVVSAEDSDGNTTVTTYNNTSAISATKLSATDTISLGDGIKGATIDADNTLTMTLADIILTAQKILLAVPDGMKPFTWYVKSFTAEATDMAETYFFNEYVDASQTYEPDEYKILIDKVNIIASGEINLTAGTKADIDAVNSSVTAESTLVTVPGENGTDEYETAYAEDGTVDISGTMYVGGQEVAVSESVTAVEHTFFENTTEQINNTDAPFSIFAALKSVSHRIDILNSTLTGSSIYAKAAADYVISVSTKVMGVSICFISADNFVKVENSDITSTSGDVSFISDKKIHLDTTSAADANWLSKFSIASAIVAGDTKAEVTGSRINSKGHINIQAVSDVISDVTSEGKKGQTFQDILSIALNYAAGGTSASVTDSGNSVSTLSSVKDINITSDNSEAFTTRSDSVVPSSSGLSGTLSTTFERVSNLLTESILAKIKQVSGSAGQAVYDDIKGLNFTELVMSVISSLYTGTTAADQYVGAFAFSYTDTDSSAFVNTRGTVNAGGALNAESTQVVNAATFSDASEEDTATDTAPAVSSSGIGIGLNVYTNDNTAYIKGAAVTAAGVYVNAKAGEKTVKDPSDNTKTITVKNGSSVGAKAGFRAGDKGPAGAVAADYVNENIKAYIENADITVTNGKDITVKADSNLITEAAATAIGGLIQSARAAGIGIAADVVMEAVNAYISADTYMAGAGNLTIEASSAGTTTDSASSGDNVNGDDFSFGSVAISVVESLVKAELKGDNNSQALQLTGDVTVKASSERTADITSGVSADG
ncbi:MAG: hypothetical protein HUJ75_02400, partial [Parasporobacterium sp.]|nr:hypothetical protein [Parasporobacterium sp.]